METLTIVPLGGESGGTFTRFGNVVFPGVEVLIAVAVGGTGVLVLVAANVAVAEGRGVEVLVGVDVTVGITQTVPQPPEHEPDVQVNTPGAGQTGAVQTGAGVTVAVGGAVGSRVGA